jgi:hypothetical protein
VRAALKMTGNRFAAGLSAGVTIGLAGVTLIGSIGVALAECKPSHFRAPYFIRSMGPCEFNSETLSFRGTPAQQAMCLMRGMDATRNLGPPLESLPPGLAERIGETTGLPSREDLSAYLSKLDLEWDLAMYLWQPVSRAHDNDPDAPTAKYFVIHDTSGPNYGHRAFPDDINTNPKINNLKRFACNDEWGKAHVVINRMGDVLVDHDFSIPWRETKFEQAAEFGGALKGLFVHTEMIQPRRAGPRGGDSHSPDPAFTPAQYDRLALIYTVVSVRAGRWLIPAFHAALDADIRNGHDDPLNFKVDSFADSLDRLMAQLQGAGPAQASNATGANDVQPDASPAASGGFWVDALWGTPHKTAPVVAAAGEDNPPKPNDNLNGNLNGMAATDGLAAPQADTGGAPMVPSAATPPALPMTAAAKPQAHETAPHEPAPHQQAAHQPAAHQLAAHQLAAHEKVAERESEPPHKEKTADLCTTHRVKGHLHQVCEPVPAAAQEHQQEHGPAQRQHHDAGAWSRRRRS